MSDDTPTYLESNKPEAERCVELAAAAWKAGDLAKAQRMLAKSLKLYPTMQAQQLILQLTQHIKDQQQAQEEHTQRQQQQQRQQQYQQQQQQQQQQQRESAARQRPSGQATPSPPSAASSPGGAGYTADQSDSARVILRLKKDYYGLFGVARTASDQEIKSSYRKLALKFHPGQSQRTSGHRAAIAGSVLTRSVVCRVFPHNCR
jgi:FtsZ-interacting cell division protein YlmF